MSASLTDTTTTADAPVTKRRIRVPKEGPLNPEQAIESLRRALEASEPWYPALLEVIGRWSAADEEIEGVIFRYLIGGEAFDWLLLAQRLLTELDGLFPEQEVERLLLFGLPPDGSSEEEFARSVGGPKHRAHLNFQYGVTIEELLLLAAELELQKAGRLSGAGQAQPDILAFERVYGKKFEELQLLYATDTDSRINTHMRQSEFQTFIYWLSKFRLRSSEPARLASDTRKALALMSRMEPGRIRLGRLENRIIDLDQPKPRKPSTSPKRARAARNLSAHPGAD
jgi:hypothetical protein